MPDQLTLDDVGRAYALLSVLPFAPRPMEASILAALVQTYRAAGVSGQDLLEAASWAAQTQSAWPAPAIIIQRVKSSRERARGIPDETAEEAWGQVIRAMQSGWHGADLPPQLSPRAKGAFCAALGPTWSGFWANAMSGDMVSHRSRFIDAYGSSSSLDRMLLEHERRKRELLMPVGGSLVAPRPLPYDRSRDEEEFDD